MNPEIIIISRKKKKNIHGNHLLQFVAADNISWVITVDLEKTGLATVWWDV
jgi:hypothetical protein